MKHKNQFHEWSIAPQHHIWPHHGLINDPNCIFWFENQLFCMFQHHPDAVMHKLKSMSLAITKDFSNFVYRFKVNQPNSKFDSAGTYSGNAIIENNHPILMYSGNTYIKNYSEREMHIIKAEYDFKRYQVVNKQSILTSSSFNNKYTSNFRDPFIFQHKYSNYMLLGAQNKLLEGCILLFRLDANWKNAQLLKEFKLVDGNYMIECPNVCFHNENAYLIYCEQFKNIKNKNLNINQCYWSKINIFNFFEKSEKQIIIKSKNKIDYGPEFYAPQIFKYQGGYGIVGWCGRSDSLKYKESKEGWIHLLTCFRQLCFGVNCIWFKPMKTWVSNFKKSKSKQVLYKKINLRVYNEIKITDTNTLLFVIKLTNQYLRIKRFNFRNDLPSVVTTNIFINSLKQVQLEFFIDHSIIEIFINKRQWYTSRFYPQNEVVFYEK